MKTATSNNKYVSGKLFYVSKYRMADIKKTATQISSLVSSTEALRLMTPNYQERGSTCDRGEKVQ